MFQVERDVLTNRYLCKHLHHIYDINIFNEATLISSVNVTLAGYVAGLDGGTSKIISESFT